VTAPWGNPELLRNARIQLRPGRAVAAAIICAAISLTAWSFYTYSPGSTGNGAALFKTTFTLQIIVLLIWGGISCLQSVHREKELNTFDYQRVTRLTSMELALGKLFGAPIMAYFVVLCLTPLSIFAVVVAHISGWLFVQAYLILLLGCIAYHSFAVLASMMLGRGTSAWVIFVFLILVWITSVNTGGANSNWQLQEFSPFVGTSVVMRGEDIRLNAMQGVDIRLYDSFFGRSLPHFAVLLVLYAIFTAWFLLGIRRNLKRDPAVYEIYSPVEAFFFALYLNVLLLGFFNWKSPVGQPIFVGNSFRGYSTLPAGEIEQPLLFGSAWIFVALGVLLLRNRERVRRRVSSIGESAAGWWAGLWPAPYVLGGIILTGLAIVELIRIYRQPGQDWSDTRALFEVAFCAAWIARDVLYLQWMNLRRTRRPLVSAFLYLVIFYTCAGVLFSVLARLMSERAVALSALLVPSPILSRIVDLWPANHALLIGILAGLAAEVFLFAFLQRQKLREFIAPAVAAPVVATRKPSLMPR
jgi:hypothetical protein